MGVVNLLETKQLLRGARMVVVEAGPALPSTAGTLMMQLVSVVTTEEDQIPAIEFQRRALARGATAGIAAFDLWLRNCRGVPERFRDYFLIFPGAIVGSVGEEDRYLLGAYHLAHGMWEPTEHRLGDLIGHSSLAVRLVGL